VLKLIWSSNPKDHRRRTNSTVTEFLITPRTQQLNHSTYQTVPQQNSLFCKNKFPIPPKRGKSMDPNQNWSSNPKTRYWKSMATKSRKYTSCALKPVCYLGRPIIIKLTNAHNKLQLPQPSTRKSSQTNPSTSRNPKTRSWKSIATKSRKYSSCLEVPASYLDRPVTIELNNVSTNFLLPQFSTHKTNQTKCFHQEAPKHETENQWIRNPANTRAAHSNQYATLIGLS
jgi:hypothetical protein